MGSVRLYVPDALQARALEELDDEVSWSGIFRQALEERLGLMGGCAHKLVECTTCGRRGSPVSLAADPGQVAGQGGPKPGQGDAQDAGQGDAQGAA